MVVDSKLLQGDDDARIHRMYRLRTPATAPAAPASSSPPRAAGELPAPLGASRSKPRLGAADQLDGR